MKKLSYIIAIAILTFITASPATADSSKKLTEKECKKMLGEKTYKRLNELYMSPQAAMVQCKLRLEDKEKRKKSKK